MDKVKKNFGFGCMRLPMNGEEVDLEQTKKMVDTFIEQGFNYFDTAHGYIQGNHLILDSSPETIRKSVEGSLKRLGTDHIDLYYQHRIDPKVEPETVAETMAALIKEGKIRYWGISETTEEYLRRAHAVCPVTAIQNRYSMMARWHETIFQACEELGVTYVAFSPLANGFLSGAYTDKTQFEPGADFRSNMPQYKGEG